MRAFSARPSVRGRGGGCARLSASTGSGKCAASKVDPTVNAHDEPPSEMTLGSCDLQRCVLLRRVHVNTLTHACVRSGVSFSFFPSGTEQAAIVTHAGSLQHVHGEMGRRGKQKSKQMVCVRIFICGCCSLETAAWLILRYFLSGVTQLCTHTHTCTVSLYTLFPQLDCSELESQQVHCYSFHCRPQHLVSLSSPGFPGKTVPVVHTRARAQEPKPIVSVSSVCRLCHRTTLEHQKVVPDSGQRLWVIFKSHG